MNVTVDTNLAKNFKSKKRGKFVKVCLHFRRFFEKYLKWDKIEKWTKLKADKTNKIKNRTKLKIGKILTN